MKLSYNEYVLVFLNQFTFIMHVIRKTLNLCANFQIREFYILYMP